MAGAGAGAVDGENDQRRAVDRSISREARLNRTRPDLGRLLDSLVREAVGAWKALRRGRHWEAVVGVERMRRSLLALRGRRWALLEPIVSPRGDDEAVAAVELGQGAQVPVPGIPGPGPQVGGQAAQPRLGLGQGQQREG